MPAPTRVPATTRSFMAWARISGASALSARVIATVVPLLIDDLILPISWRARMSERFSRSRQMSPSDESAATRGMPHMFTVYHPAAVRRCFGSDRRCVAY
jgi:hypothetical protein